MKKILYVSHIPWSWIKQRPHFIAAGISELNEVVFVNPKKCFSTVKDLNQTDSPNFKLANVYVLPLSRYFIVSLFNSWIISLYVFLVKHKYDIIWYTCPSNFVKTKTDVKVIYDCMDDMLEFKQSYKKTKWIFKKESALVNSSDLVVCSSDYLKSILNKRYRVCESKIQVVNNAISETLLSNISVLPDELFEKMDSKYLKFIYIGTISSWFDFELIIESLERFDNIEYLLFGPSDIVIPRHDRIRHLGLVEHRYLISLMSFSDALVMPFIVNDLIKSVNPVKLYEYVYSYKPTLVIEYGETAKFENYVFLYKDKFEYLKLVESVVLSSCKMKKNIQNHHCFSKLNTWNSRLCVINALIAKL